MIIEQLYTNCLAEAAYYIESNGEVAVIDPLRETEPYIALAAKSGVKIKYIFETHFHADFVSGHIDLARKTGATIVYGPTAQTGFESHIATDGEVFHIGNITIIALHTPGHTLESTTYLLRDKNGKDYCIFTGDTLFIGDVGRPDLAVKSDLTQEDLAGMLYDSLHNKIMPLADDVIVYPAHGAGSACGKNMSKETFALLGVQKLTNYALCCSTKEDFIREVTSGLTPPPQYFPKNAAMNKSGYENIDIVMERGNNPLPPDEFEIAAEHALILDVRREQDFVQGFIPGSMFIGLHGQFAVWAGTLIEDLRQPILLVAPEGCEHESVQRLARVGYDNVIGYLKGSFEAWQKVGKKIEVIPTVSSDEFAQIFNAGETCVIDVRKKSEYDSRHIENAENSPLDYINKQFATLPADKPAYIHCAAGYRSVIAASVLLRKGVRNIINIAGGFSAICDCNKIPVTDYTCPASAN
ncbi:MBL fold metallo-hydrolase [Ignavibacteria bacterium]|nr:MBL fold metallo-hydrolase [Bacteroidota bacterium]MCZ2131624.1 MBL fold metallo-hydrolase [Bacteroidota bacterium]